MNVDAVVEVLRKLDRTQRETDERGQREIAWWYLRDEVEDARSVWSVADSTQRTTVRCRRERRG